MIPSWASVIPQAPVQLKGASEVMAAPLVKTKTPGLEVRHDKGLPSTI
jgi:hypothetical protein